MNHSTQIRLSGSSIGRAWWIVLLFGVAATLFGLVAILNPVQAGVSLIWIVGIFAIAEGVISLFGVFGRNVPSGRAWLIGYAVLSLLFGGLAVFFPTSMAMAFIVIMGAWFLVSGVVRVSFALRVRKEIDNEWLLVLSGTLMAILGVFMVLSPAVGLAVTIIWIGVAALFFGVLQIMAAFRIRRLM